MSELIRALAVLSEPPGPEQTRLGEVLGLDGVPDPAEYTEVFALQLYPYASVYLGAEGMLGYVAKIQREEVRQGIATVKHQNMSGSDVGDDHKEYFSGDAALKAGGVNNTMNQFAAE